MWIPFHDRLDGLFQGRSSIWLKVLGGAFVGAFIALEVLSKEVPKGEVQKFPAFSFGNAGAAVLVTAGIAALLCFAASALEAMCDRLGWRRPGLIWVATPAALLISIGVVLFLLSGK